MTIVRHILRFVIEYFHLCRILKAVWVVIITHMHNALLILMISYADWHHQVLWEIFNLLVRASLNYTDNRDSALPEGIISYLSLFHYDDAGSVWERVGKKRGLDGSQNEVSVSLDHRCQVLPFWLTAVIHRYLVWWHQMSLISQDER